MSAYEERAKRTEWFRKDRFGMFIHWGLYAIPARGEWVRSKECISVEDYQQYFEEFNPIYYDPRKWARLAKNAGMKYAVLTTKHHDGFCLFDSAYTDYKATNTKAGRDLVREYVDAFRAEGLKVGFYYSLLDWHHPDYPHYGDRQHPMRFNEEYKGKEHHFENYVTYMHNQVRELLTNYGKIDIMWFDFSYDDMSGEKWEATKLVEMIRSLQPDIILDNRLSGDGNTGIEAIDDNTPIYKGDFESPEQIIPAEGLLDTMGRKVPWEACMTLNNNWGYAAADKDYKSAKDVIRMLVECVSKDGNLLINVGPTAKGEITKESVAVLEQVGEWMHENCDSIYHCGMAEQMAKPEWGRYTQNGNKLYAHVYDKFVNSIRFDNLNGKVKKIRLLSDGSELSMEKPWNSARFPDDLFTTITSSKLPDEIDTVIELELL